MVPAAYLRAVPLSPLRRLLPAGELQKFYVTEERERQSWVAALRVEAANAEWCGEEPTKPDDEITPLRSGSASSNGAAKANNGNAKATSPLRGQRNSTGSILSTVHSPFGRSKQKLSYSSLLTEDGEAL